MADSSEKQFCGVCGEEARPKALFCFHCGSQVASDEEVQAENANQKKISDAWFKEEIAESPMAKTVAATKAEVTVEDKPKVEEKPKVAVKEKAKTGENGKTLQTADSIKLKSAASLRDKSKTVEKKRVEVTWEAPSNAPNAWFLIVSLLLIGFAVFILFAMLYIR